MISKTHRGYDIIKKSIAFMIVTALFLSITCLISFAETGGMMTENIPDTNIGGATGGASEFVSEVASGIMSGDQTPAASSAPTSPSDTSGTIMSSPEQSSTRLPAASSSDTGTSDSEKDSRSVIGIVIAVIAVIALILIILIFIPKNGDKGGSSGFINDGGTDDMMRR